MNALLRHRPQTQHTQSAAPPPPVHDAVDLTRGGVQARIRLGEQIYTLRITRQGKLILTK